MIKRYDDLIKRLRGKYSVGPNGVYGDRDFGTFTPRICTEAADTIEELIKEVERLTAKYGKSCLDWFERGLKIDDLSAEVERLMSHSENNQSLCGLQEVTIKNLEAEVERLKGGWISVQDRLPDGLSSVIALLKNNAVMELTYSSFTKHWFRTGGSNVCSDNPVTHWMPFPEPLGVNNEKE